MYKIGENIHIVSPSVKQAINDRDGSFFVELARKQQEAGADALDLNIGPQKKAGPEVMDWLVDCMQEAVPGMTLSFDTTNCKIKTIEQGSRNNEHVLTYVERFYGQILSHHDQSQRNQEHTGVPHEVTYNFIKQINRPE